MIQMVVYDGSFEGFLTAVFEVYEYKLDIVKIVKKEEYQASVFGEDHTVHTETEKARRVWNGILRYSSPEAAEHLYHTWLSEIPGIEKYLLNYIRYLFQTKKPVHTDFSNEAVLKVAQTTKKVHRERHRMEAFIRFQLTQDGIYYAVIEPDFNVLPLLVSHFKNRYADQRWLIYDGKRKFGLFYNLERVETITLTFSNAVNASDVQMVYDEQEPLYQSLWQQYFSSVNIKARKNTKLHIQHMPKRYWKHLTEKQPAEVKNNG